MIHKVILTVTFLILLFFAYLPILYSHDWQMGIAVVLFFIPFGVLVAAVIDKLNARPHVLAPLFIFFLGTFLYFIPLWDGPWTHPILSIACCCGMGEIIWQHLKERVSKYF
ncbi:MAG: hypothetical protein ISS36_02575 [Candidatus Aenigmarchaeota archaeon]|nr:hypothetical protein [Candidatus Aenigmarchaeota archaeon]